MKKILKYIFFTVVLLPIILVAQCVYIEMSQSSDLEEFCDERKQGLELNSVMSEINESRFVVRRDSGGVDEEHDWFNKEYKRLVTQIKNVQGRQISHLVVFAKPGIGYYACIIAHDHGMIKGMRFEDRSS